MSSDVYFHIYEDKEKSEYIESISVGHLGVLCYFGFDALKSFQKNLRLNEPITSELISRLKIIIRHAHASILIDQNLSEEEFCSCYGYLGPNGVEWD